MRDDAVLVDAVLRALRDAWDRGTDEHRSISLADLEQRASARMFGCLGYHASPGHVRAALASLAHAGQVRYRMERGRVVLTAPVRMSKPQQKQEKNEQKQSGFGWGEDR